MSDERLKALYAKVLERRAGSGCDVPPETMLAVLERKLPDAERRRVLLAIMGDPRCREEFDLLRAVVEQAPDGTVPRPWARAVRPLALAAGLALFLGTAVGVRAWLGRDRTEPFREGGGHTELRLIRPAPVVGSPAGLVFAWQPASGVLRYDYNLVTRAGRVIFSATLSDTALTLPDSVRLRPDQEYRWWVEATLATGVQLRSAVRPLRITNR